MAKQDGTSVLDKIQDIRVVEKSFTNDQGKEVDYTRFEIDLSVNGQPYTFEAKADGMADKVALIELADKA